MTLASHMIATSSSSSCAMNSVREEKVLSPGGEADQRLRWSFWIGGVQTLE